MDLAGVKLSLFRYFYPAGILQGNKKQYFTTQSKEFAGGPVHKKK